jgi:predicted ATPase
MRVLLTGMSGTGKSALVQELRQRGYAGPQRELADLLLQRIAEVEPGIV